MKQMNLKIDDQTKTIDKLKCEIHEMKESQKDYLEKNGFQTINSVDEDVRLLKDNVK